MKKLALSFAIMLLAFSSAFAGPKKDTRTVTFDTFLHCKECVKKVQENIAFEKGVKDLEVSLEKQKITIDYDAGKTSVETLKKSIEKLGYKAIERKDGKGASKD